MTSTIRRGWVSSRQARKPNEPLKYDIRQPGNSNAGHIYGTDLSADDKRR